MSRYSRQDVLRILHLHTRQMTAWERAGLISPSEEYAFEDLSRLRTLRDLQATTRVRVDGSPVDRIPVDRIPVDRIPVDRIPVDGIAVDGVPVHGIPPHGTPFRRISAKSLHAKPIYTKPISAKSIRASVDAMQRVAGMRNPLMEASAVRRGSRLSFRHGGALMDPLTQQLAFDFETSPARQLRVVRATGQTAAQQAAQHAAEVQEMFLSAVRMEESPSTISAAIEVYEKILTMRSDHAPTLINLGTIQYNQRRYQSAEQLYRRATVADPEYALAFFDLGNVLDEMQQLDEATASYQRAVALVPQYADAHYNLALAYERKGQQRRALRHWLAYVRLDPVGPWSIHARAQARKILSAEKLSIVSRRGRLIAV